MAEDLDDITSDESRLLARIEGKGWRLLPIEPSDFMLRAGEAVAPGRAKAVWDAMTGQAPDLVRHGE